MDFPAPFWKGIKKAFGEKASTGLVILLFLAYAIIDKGPAWIEALKKEKPPPPVMGERIVEEQPEKQMEDLNCAILMPLEEYSVEKEYEKIKKKGDFYYPTGSGDTWEGAVWVKKFLKPNFKKMFIEYGITSKENYEKPPAFIWTISRITNEEERQHIAKVWVPEFSESNGINFPQLVGFARTLDYDQEKLKRDSSLELSDSVKSGKLDSLTIERTDISGNEMTINFKYDYTSERTGVAMTYPFTKKLTFPFSNLSSSNEQLDFGLGTFVGHGLRIISLEICY